MSDTGRLIYHSNYDKTPIQAQAAERIDLKERWSHMFEQLKAYL